MSNWEKETTKFKFEFESNNKERKLYIINKNNPKDKYVYKIPMEKGKMAPGLTSNMYLEQARSAGRKVGINTNSGYPNENEDVLIEAFKMLYED
jgi:hypothetical protein